MRYIITLLLLLISTNCHAVAMMGKISDDTLIVLKADSSTHSLQTMGYEHHEIHGGSHYILDDVVDIAINNVVDIQWTTPDTAKWGHFTFLVTSEAETEWMAYEGAVISVDGIALTPINSNRNSSKTSNMTVATITNNSLANANLDTQVDGALTIAHGIVGAGRNGGFEERNREIILKQNTIYCFRLIANAAGYINFVINWYEHTDKS